VNPWKTAVWIVEVRRRSTQGPRSEDTGGGHGKVVAMLPSCEVGMGILPTDPLEGIALKYSEDDQRSGVSTQGNRIDAVPFGRMIQSRIVLVGTGTKSSTVPLERV